MDVRRLKLSVYVALAVAVFEFVVVSVAICNTSGWSSAMSKRVYSSELHNYSGINFSIVDTV